MKAKTFFGIFVAMAVVPLGLAYMTLKFNWFTPAATNKGEFMAQEVTIALEKEQPTWTIIYQPQENECDQLCKEQLYGLNQTYIALGKLQKRVDAFVLSGSIDLSDYPATRQVETQFSQLDSNFLYVVDPMGKVVLRYQASPSREQTIMTSKYILSDLKKLLKYARIG